MQYAVSPDGRDEGPGTCDAPFRTLARASATLAPGDTCLLRAGVYRETLRPARSGEPGRPIVFRPHPGEMAVLDGADPLTGWQAEGHGLWSAPMPWDLADRNQLFAGDRALVEARWPHTPPGGDPLFQPRRALAAGGSPDTLTDPALPAGDWRGAVLWCAGGHKWICWGARVTGFEPATHTLAFARNPFADGAWYTPKEGSEYVLIGARAALGRPGEWWRDPESGRVWLVPPPGCANPAEAAIAAKRRTAVADLRGRAHIHLVGLDFRAGGIATDEESASLRLEGLRGEYVAHSYLENASEEAVLLAGRDHLVFNGEFRNSSGAVLSLKGQGHRLVNCLIERGNYGGMWSGALAVSGRRHLLRHNTVRHSGRDLVSLHRFSEGVMEYNDLSHAGWLTHDLGITYGHDTDFAGTRIRWNHVHDCVAKGLGQGIYFDHCSHNVVVHDNLFWNIPDMPVQINNPGYFNLVARNTAWRTNTHSRVISTFDHTGRNDLYGCRYLDNRFNAPFDLPDHVVCAGNRVEPDAGPPAGGLPWRAGRDAENPADPDAPVDRPPLSGLNLLRNAAFELGTLEGWTPLPVGRAEIVRGNGWGNPVTGSPLAATGTSKHELRLAGGGGVSQSVTGLTAGRRYRLSAWLRTGEPAYAAELVARDFGGEPVSVRGVAHEWTRLELEFTAGAGSVTVEVRQETAAPAGISANADNLGLVEIDG